MNAEILAGQLYTVYCIDVGGKAFNGDPLPKWPEFRDDPKKQVQVNAWIGVAKTAMRVLEGGND